VTADLSWKRRSRRSRPKAPASSCTCEVTRAAASDSTQDPRVRPARGGRDTVDANLELGLPVDSREYGVGAQILVDLGVTSMRVMTNNPSKYGGLEGFGLNIVERVPLESSPTAFNIDYLRTKRERLGHLLGGLDDVD